MTNNPSARTSELVIQRVEDELLVYDLTSHNAVCLNSTMSLIWESCDGTKSPKEIARDIGISGDLVLYAIELLIQQKLIQEPFETNIPAERIKRRELLIKASKFSAFAIPVIFSLVAPTPLNAQSCTATGTVPSSATGPDGSTCIFNCGSVCCSTFSCTGLTLMAIPGGFSCTCSCTCS